MRSLMVNSSVARSRTAEGRAGARAFTLIELLVVVAIIGLLAGLGFSALTGVQRTQRLTQCTSNLRQIGMFIGLYMSENDNRFPVDSTGNLEKWIQTLKTFNNNQMDYRIFKCPEDKIVRVYSGSPRSYAVNVYAVPSAMGRRVVTTKNSAELVLISERAYNLSVIGRDGANDIWTATDIKPQHKLQTYASTLFVDMHIDLLQTNPVPAGFQNRYLSQP